MLRFVLTVTLAGLVCAAAYADTIVLTNGGKLRGKIESENEKEVVINVSNMGTITVQRRRIKKIIRDMHTGPAGYTAKPETPPAGGKAPGTSEQPKPLTVKELKAVIKILRPLHKKLGKPRLGDFLANNPSQRETFEQYLKCRPITPTRSRNTIYIQPLGKFTHAHRRIMRLTADFIGIRFNLPVNIKADLPIGVVPNNSWRVHPALGRQIYASDILDKVLKPRLPKDAAAYIAFTTTDLHYGPGSNFTFGWTSSRERVSVMSFCHLGQPDASRQEFQRTLVRALQAGMRGMGRMFTMDYCVTYECVMCGSDSLEESDRYPVWMCPDCMAKACWATKADPLQRYKKLVAFCKKHGLRKEQELYEKSLKALPERPKKRAWRNTGGLIANLIEKLRSGDRRDKIKAAAELGDMEIAGKLTKLSKAERAELDAICDELIADAGDQEDHQKRIFANEQLERLWTIGTERLVKAIGDADPKKAECIIKKLILMRNKRICEMLKKKYDAAGEDTRWRVVFALGCMKEQRRSMVKGRSCLGEKESDRLVKGNVIPFLKARLRTEKSLRVGKGIASALKALGAKTGMGDELRRH